MRCTILTLATLVGLAAIGATTAQAGTNVAIATGLASQTLTRHHDDRGHHKAHKKHHGRHGCHDIDRHRGHHGSHRHHGSYRHHGSHRHHGGYGHHGHHRHHGYNYGRRTAMYIPYPVYMGRYGHYTRPGGSFYYSGRGFSFGFGY